VSDSRPAAPGLFVPVIGPSGVGKDSVMAYAARRLAGHPGIVFVRRVVTRPADAGGEDHDSLDEAAFLARAADGGFSLHWSAHGLHYGLPLSARADVDAGKVVVANLSRTMIAEARRRFPAVQPVVVTAARPVVAARLAARGRESEAEIARRLARLEDWHDTADAVPIDNSGPLALAGERLASLLHEAGEKVRLRSGVIASSFN